MTSAPIKLYSWRYAGWGIDVEANGETWQAADISDSGFVSGGDIIGDGPTITLSTDDATHPFRISLDPFTKPATVTIYEVDALVPAFDLPVFVGEVVDVDIGKVGKISIRLSSILRVAERSGPRVQIKRTCHHDLYDARCGLTAATFTTTGAIDAINESPPWVEASEFATKATAESDPNWFALGKVICGDEIRFCVGQSAGKLYLNAPFRNAAVLDSISALAGCDKRINSGCAKFSNTANFLGFPYLPNVNPQYQALMEPQPEGGKK
jgi:uncharacterized phage protein (TIGR02218 family)